MAQPFDPVRMALSGDAGSNCRRRRFLPGSVLRSVLRLQQRRARVPRRRRAGAGADVVRSEWEVRPACLANRRYANPVVVARSEPHRRGTRARRRSRHLDRGYRSWQRDDPLYVRSRERRLPRMVARQRPGSCFPRIAQARQRSTSSARIARARNACSSISPGTPTSWSTDGRFLLFTSTTPKTAADIWALPDPRRVTGDTKPFSFSERCFAESRERSSLPTAAGSRTLSNESQRATSTFGHFHQTAPRARQGANGSSPEGVSTALCAGIPMASGCSMRTARHSISSRSISTRARDSRLALRNDCSAAPPPLLLVDWSLAPDGQRFIFVTTPDGGKPTPFTVVLNLAAALRSNARRSTSRLPRRFTLTQVCRAFDQANEFVAIPFLVWPANLLARGSPTRTTRHPAKATREAASRTPQRLMRSRCSRSSRTGYSSAPGSEAGWSPRREPCSAP